MNLIEIILKQICNGDTLSKIASLLGIGTDQAGKAVSAAVPSLLAGLIGSASKPEGATHLANLLSKQDPGMLDNFGGMMSQGAAAGTGISNPLSSLFGAGGLGQMAGALSKFTGVGDSAITKLLGIISPFVLGIIGKHSQGLSASGLASMLSAQKANVTSALPSGLRSMLSSAVPGLGSILGSASSAASAAVDTTAAAAAGAARQVGAAGSSAMRWLIPAIIILVLALVLLPRLFRKGSDAVNDVQRGVETAVTSSADSTKIVSSVSSLIQDATQAVTSIKDEASATANLPKLQEINTKLGDLKGLWTRLPASAQKTVADTLRPLTTKLRASLEPVLRLPGIGDKLKPVVDEMLRSLDSFAA